MSDSNAQLKQVYQLIKSGKKLEARQILLPILKVEKDNSTAWFLMANAVEKQDQQVKALQKVLTLRPDHQKAQEMLDKLQAPPMTKPQPNPRPKAVAAPVAAPVEEDDPFAAPKKTRRRPKQERESAFSEFDDDPFDAPPKKTRRKSIREQVADFSEFDDDDDPFAMPRKPQNDEHLFVDPFDDDDDPFKHLGKAKNSHLGRTAQKVAVKKKSNFFTNADGSTNIGAVILTFVGGMFACGALLCGVVFYGATSLAPAFEEIVQESDWESDWEYEDEFSPSMATQMGEIPNFRTVHNNLRDAFDLHAYTFTGTEGQVMEIELNAATAGLDTMVTLYGPGDNYIAENDDRDWDSGNTNSYLYFSLPSSGTYTIIVSSFMGSGNYDLTLRLN